MPSRKRPSWTEPERDPVKRHQIMPPSFEDSNNGAAARPSAARPVPSESSNATSSSLTSPVGTIGVPTFMYPSLSASLNNSASPPAQSWSQHNPLQQSQDQEKSGNNGTYQAPRSGRASPPGHLDIPKMPAIASIAMSAMQYLPTPTLVLSSLKIVSFANDAMGRLLGLDLMHEDSQELEYNATGKLLGQSLGQIGIDLIQDGQPIWVNWEKFLDGLSQRSAARSSNSSGGVNTEPDQAVKELVREASTKDGGDGTSANPSPTSKRKRPDSDQGAGNQRVKDKPFVHDTAVDVVLSSQYIGTASGAINTQSMLPYKHVQARMVITIWSMEGQQFFTLTFSAATSESTSVRTQMRIVSQTPTGNNSPSSILGDRLATRCSHCGSSSHPAATPPPRTSPNDHPLSMAPLPLAHSTAQPTTLQRTLKLKDAIINGMQIPKFAMWRDESVVVPNKAAEQLIKRHTDPTSDETLDPLTRFQPWTDDFSRTLSPDENPIVILCRTQKPFKSMKVGYHDKDGNRVVYDIQGECLYDESGEFIGGITALKDVTDLAVQLQEQSDRNELQFELICDCMPQIAWTTTPTGGHVDWFSKRWYEYTGLSEEESLGERWAETFHPDDMPETGKRWLHSLATGDEYVTEYRARSRTGEWRWMLGRALPLRDYKDGSIVKWFGTCTDIHELVEARSEQKRLHEQLLNVIDHAKVTVWSTDREKTLTFLEGQAMWQLGDKKHNNKDLIGRNIQDVFGTHAGASDLRRYVGPIDRILAGDVGEHIAEHHIDGTNRWYRTRFVPILGSKLETGRVRSDLVEGVVGVSQDVSELKVREQELQNTEKENIRLISAETAAKEASRLKSQFLANMSHEIRTPIAGVIGMADLLTDTDLNEDQKELAENIQRSANGLLTVINDILDLSKVESGRLDIEEVQFSLSVVLRDVGKMMSFAAERKGLAYEQNFKIGKGSEDDFIVLGDPGRCRQILTNLLTNSIKFTSEGSVSMSAWVQSETSDLVTVSFQVEDTGIGIEEEVRKKLFKPFSQADSSTARRFGGTGLGLTICKNLVQLMKGEIRLDSVLGQGTKATFTIPFAKQTEFSEHQEPLVNLGAMPDRFSSELSMSAKGSSDRATPPQTPGDGSRLPGSSLARKALSVTSLTSDLGSLLPPDKRKDVHVLVVEDNHINQQIATRTIKKLGFKVSAVWNGKEALEYLLRSNDSAHNPEPDTFHKPDVILMDVQMPILDGYRATHQIRYHDPYRKLPGMDNIPIVAMTASAIQGDREKCQKAGMDDYLSKPVNSGILEKMLVKWTLRSQKSKGSERRESVAAQTSSHSDHDSNCTETDVVLSSVPPFNQPTYPQSQQSKKRLPEIHESPPTTRLQPRSRLADSPSFPDVMSPPAESEGDRGLRRQAAEEKASALRDDKLVQAAGSDDDHSVVSHQSLSTSLAAPRMSMRRAHTGNPSDHVRHPSKFGALTAENLGTMNRERQASVGIDLCGDAYHPAGEIIVQGGGGPESSLAEASHRADDGRVPARPTQGLLQRESGDSMTTTADVKESEEAHRVAMSQTNSGQGSATSSGRLRVPLNRGISSASEKTVTPKSLRDSR